MKFIDSWADIIQLIFIPITIFLAVWDLKVDIKDMKHDTRKDDSDENKTKGTTS